MTDALGNWVGQFGKDYTDRNQYDPESRVNDFRNRLIPSDAHYILEVGCNYGNNLASLESIGKEVIGIEPNEYAIQKGIELRRSIIPGTAYKLPFSDKSFDLVFTCGVLIHIPPERLEEAMREMERVTKKYILVIEYLGDEGMKEYRGLNDMLWKRKTYRWDGFSFRSLGELGQEWDNASYLLYERT